MKYTPLLLLLLLFNSAVCQTDNEKRADKIKNCTVRVVVGNNEGSGTGFFISSNGSILTCWHVVESAVIRSPSDHSIVGLKKIIIIRNGTDTIQVGIPGDIINSEYRNALVYDYCVLRPIKTIAGCPHLKIGNYNNAKSGDAIYTCGYPLGISQQSLSYGYFSTKYTEPISWSDKGKVEIILRDQALLNITMNRGNSGGAIIKTGNTPDDDEVIGIADFIISPLGENADKLYSLISLLSKTKLMAPDGYDINEILSNLLKYASNTSIGVSGCVSINYPYGVPQNIKN